MRPTLAPGDRVLVDYRRRPAADDVVVARFADGTLVVKRVRERRERGWFLVSDNPGAPYAVDSHARGPVPEEDVLGVVRGRVWPRPGRLSAAPHSPR